jgi:hypothetical protein
VYQFNSNGASVKAISSVKIYNLAFVAVLPDEKFIYSVVDDDAN